MSVYRKHGGQRGYKGHVLNLSQDIQGFLDRLPCNVQEIPILLLRRNGQDNTHTDLRVRRDRVLSALEWLQSNNPFYSNITIDHMALQRLPHDGVPTELLSADDIDEPDAPTDDTVQDCSSHSFLPLPNRTAKEEEAIRSVISEGDPLDWPNIAGQPTPVSMVNSPCVSVRGLTAHAYV